MRFVVCDLAGNALGEPEAYGRSLQVGISRMSTASFRIRVDDPLWPQLSEEESRLKIYDDGGALRFYGPIITDEETGDGHLQCNAADMTWELSKRWVGKDLNGVGRKWDSTESGQIVSQALSEINAEKATGVIIGDVDATVVRTVTFLWTKFTDMLSSLGGIYGSYEWALRYADGSPPTCYLDLRVVLGADVSSTVFFEYGMGRGNLADYSRARSREGRATRVYALGANSTLTSVAISEADETYQRHEDVLQFNDLTVTALLDALALAHVAARSRTQVSWTLTPFPLLAPQWGIEWQIGDRVWANIFKNGRLRIGGLARIWAAEITTDEFGTTNARPTIAPQN